MYCLTDHSSGAPFLPFAIFTRDFFQQIQEALLDDRSEGLEAASIKIPSLTWLEYQFAPANTGYASCLRLTRTIYDDVLRIYINLS